MKRLAFSKYLIGLVMSVALLAGCQDDDDWYSTDNWNYTEADANNTICGYDWETYYGSGEYHVLYFGWDGWGDETINFQGRPDLTEVYRFRWWWNDPYSIYMDYDDGAELSVEDIEMNWGLDSMIGWFDGKDRTFTRHSF